MIKNILSDEILYYYLDSIQYMSDDDAYELLIQYKENPNSELEFKLFEQYAKFIFKKARKCCNKDNARYTVSDLFQEGYIGFRIALEKFNIESGNKFLTYAAWWIDRFIKDYVNRNRFDFSISRPAAYDLIRVANFINNTATEEYRQITKTDVKEKFTNLDDKKCELYCNALQPPVKLDEIIDDDSSDTKINFVLIESNFDDHVASIDRDERINYLVNRISKKRNADMVKMYYGFEPYTKQHTTTAIGKKYNISRQCVSGIIAREVKKLYNKIYKDQEQYDF